MQLERFTQLAASYGSSIERWPQDERAAARHLASYSQEAATALAEETMLDAMLSQWPAFSAPDTLLAHMQRLPAQLPQRVMYWRTRLTQAMALSLCLVFGALSGVMMPAAKPHDPAAWIIAPDRSMEMNDE